MAPVRVLSGLLELTFFLSLPSEVAGKASVMAIRFSVLVFALGRIVQSSFLMVTIVTHAFSVMRSLTV